MYALSPELIEKLKIQARQLTLYDEEEYDLLGSCGGNYDDAYNIGQSDGETSMARMILTSLNISWE
jgi:hypothetical protein